MSCTNDDVNTLRVDDMVNIGTIQASQIDVSLNGEKIELNGGISLASDDTNTGGHLLRIGGLIPNDVLNVPVAVTSDKDKLHIDGKVSLGDYSDINVEGDFIFHESGSPHLALNIKYVVNSNVTGRQFIFDLVDNPFSMIEYRSGTTEIDGINVDNVEALTISANAINRDLAERSKKIRLVFDSSGVLTVDTIGSGDTGWKPVDKLRYWLTSEDRRDIIIGLTEAEKAVFGNLWFGEPLYGEKHVYFSSLPLVISIVQNGDYAFFTLKHIIQSHILGGYISYKQELNQWSKEEALCLRVLTDLVYKDYQKRGHHSSLWSIQASVIK